MTTEKVDLVYMDGSLTTLTIEYAGDVPDVVIYGNEAFRLDPKKSEGNSRSKYAKIISVTVLKDAEL